MMKLRQIMRQRWTVLAICAKSGNQLEIIEGEA
jgi:hypothetical protein